MRRALAALLTAAAIITVQARSAAAGVTDYAQTALNIFPSGQYGSVPVPTGADRQARMFNALTPRFDHVTGTDLNRDFKSERFGIATDGPATAEPVPHAGVAIVRDRFDVPHVTATTHDGGVWAAGWIVAQDRGLLLQQVRGDARVAAIDAPGLSAIGLVSNLQTFTPSARTEELVSRQTQALLDAGAEGRDVLHDIDIYVSGINAFLKLHSPATPPWTRNDVYAVNALKDQYLGEGGGDEARRSEFLAGLERRLGVTRGYSVFNDLRQNLNAGSPTTVDGTFNYGHAPDKAGAPGGVVLDPGSFKPISYGTATKRVRNGSVQPRTEASNVLMVESRSSTTGHPLLVGGPQIGFFYPGLTLEIDMHAPGLDWRGATSAPFPGYLLIGRGADFATTLTSTDGDDIDQYAETLCGASDTRYLYRGRCRTMGTFDAGSLNGSPVIFRTTVHGPVVGYATARGHTVAISSKRASYGKDVLDLLFNRRLSDGQVRSPKSFLAAAALTPQTFNAFYIDSRHVAEFTTGAFPLRPQSVDPSLPTLGTGRYEWRGFLPVAAHPQGVDPQHAPLKGTMVNWNNDVAHGFGAADNAFGRTGSAARVDLLNGNLRRLRRHGKWSLATVTSAMNAAASQDVRAIDTVPLLARLLKGTRAPSRQAARMLSLLVSWRAHGGNRLDLNHDGRIDAPGAAILDGAWTPIANAFMRPQLGSQLGELNTLFRRWDQPAAVKHHFDSSVNGQYNGWYQYFDRDIKKLLKIPQPQPFANSYCGHGSLKRCRQAIWGAIAVAGRELTKQYGGPDPAAWRASATAETIDFVPINLFTLSYTNRPSGIQQVITFNRHR